MSLSAAPHNPSSSPSKPQIEAFFDPATSTVTYLVSDPQTKAAIIIDPVLDYEPKAARTSQASIDKVLKAVSDQGLNLEWVLETHVHADHLSGAFIIRARTGAKIAIGAHVIDTQRIFAPMFGAGDVGLDGAAFDLLLGDGDTLAFGALELTALHTPGHTPACMTYIIGDAAFVGDTLFMPDYGTARTDFPGGSAEALYKSIRNILALPDATRIFVGHDYLPAGRTQFAWETSVSDQKEHNIHMHYGVPEADFVSMRRAKDKTLSPPLLILPALQVNIRAGDMPPADADGSVYLRLPVNQLGG